VIGKVLNSIATKANYVYVKLSGKLDDLIALFAKHSDNANVIKVMEVVADADGVLMLKTTDIFEIGFDKYRVDKVDDLAEAAVKHPEFGDAVYNVPAETDNVAEYVLGTDNVNGRTEIIGDAYEKNGAAGVEDICRNGNGCFTAETPVSTASGLVRIEEIKPGDRVYSFNSQNGDVSVNRVLNVTEIPANELIHVTLSDNETINATPEHPFYVPVKGWTSAVNLRAGDVLYTLNGEYVIVEQVQHEILEKPVWVYNFTVADDHTYFVGENAVGVHNVCGDSIDTPFDGKNGLQYSSKSPRKLKSDTWYKTGEFDYKYHTNADGYIDHVSVDDLTLSDNSHSYRYQNPAGKQTGDHSGHLIGDRFGGSNGLDNIVAMDAHINQSEFKVIENQWAKALSENKTVKIDIGISYDTNGRPISFDINYSIDGIDYNKMILNGVKHD
jgi:hypothetical protein